MYEYDVALSFAGENREYVRGIAKKLKAKKLKVFFDEFEEANLWGKDLYQYLHYVYKECALFCVVFVSSSYIEKAWTRHELKAVQNRAFLDNSEYILPLILESGLNLSGLPDTIGYISTKCYTATQIVKIIYEKINNVKPLKREEFETRKKIYNIVFQTFNFIIEKYTCFGEGAKKDEICIIQCLISEYKNFLLEHAHEINADLYVFLVQILKELETYIENNEIINIYHSANLQYKTDVLNMMKRAFENSGFSSNFDFYYYLYSKVFSINKEDMLLSSLKKILQNISSRIEKPISFMEYLEQIVRLMCFDEYIEDEDNTDLIQKMLYDCEELKEAEKKYNDSAIIKFDKD